MNIDDEKINYYRQRGYIDIDDHAKFKYVVEIIRLFNIYVRGWMKGFYPINENEGIMFINNKSKRWTDTRDDEYIYERCDIFENRRIAKRNEYWGDKTIYVFRKENNDGYEFIGCFKQDEEKIEELFAKNIIDQRAYRKVGSRIALTKYN